MKFWRFRIQISMVFLAIGAATSLVAAPIKFSLPVPVYGQLQDTWCWAASDQMVRAKFYDFTDQCNIVNIGLNPPGGTNCCITPTHADCLHGRGSTLASTGYQVRDLALGMPGFPLSFADMKSQIAWSGRPIIAAAAYSGGGGHQVVVRGITIWGTELVGINNPLAGGDFVWVTYASFLSGPGYSLAREYVDISKNP